MMIGVKSDAQDIVGNAANEASDRYLLDMPNAEKRIRQIPLSTKNRQNLHKPIPLASLFYIR